MSVPITLSNLANLENESTAVSTINTNSNAITTAFGSALDTSGDVMEGNLDMNSNRILNLPQPVNNDEPLRLQDLVSFSEGGSINITNPGPASSLPLADGTAAVGTSTLYARQDHVHPQLILPATNLPLGLGSASVGVSTLYARQDHVHPNTGTTPNHGDNSTALATTAYVQAERLNPSGPLEFGNAVNTILQVADPGIGSTNRNSRENVFFYDSDGSGLLGPGARTDLEIVTTCPWNLFIAHHHTRFKQAAYSTSRPSADTLWSGIGGGSFSINNNNSYGGVLEIQTGTSSAGDGGTVYQDYNGITLGGTKVYILMYLGAATDQVINWGLFYDVNNQIYLSRSDTSTEGNWVAHCMAGGVSTSVSVSPTLNNGTNRTIFAIDYDGTNVNFWVGNSNDTIVSAAQISTNIPNPSLVYQPFLNFTSQVAAVNRQLFVTDWYTITNG